MPPVHLGAPRPRRRVSAVLAGQRGLIRADVNWPLLACLGTTPGSGALSGRIAWWGEATLPRREGLYYQCCRLNRYLRGTPETSRRRFRNWRERNLPQQVRPYVRD